MDGRDVEVGARVRKAPRHVHLEPLLERALDHRRDLLTACEHEGTDCHRLFHGTAEGRPGLTIDRYGPVLLVQSFHAPLAPDELAVIEGFYMRAQSALTSVVYNDRSEAGSRVRNADAQIDKAATSAHVVRELGVAYRFRARHRGSDPFLFLDLRVVRRRMRALAQGASVLNLFAYTCGVGVAAAVHGASRVLNVDFSRSSLEVGRENAALNDVSARSVFFESDFFPAVRQLAGLGLAKPRRHGVVQNTPRIDPETFDVVVLDPPRYAKSAFGVVDLVNDYGAVFKPSLLATREGGTLICCNNVARVSREPWLEALERGVRKNGRTLRAIESLVPEADFPSVDANPPLKIAVLSV